MLVNAFTCTGSYAILILSGIKRTENRSAWPSPSEGRAAISCSKSFCKEEYGRFIAWASVNLPPEDFAAVLDAIESALGPERAHAMHIHFSTIEYTAAGEKRHRTFAEEAYGPRFQHLAPLLKERGYQPRVICECKGTMAEDAKAMMEMYESLQRL